jgi:hypothetical protein
MDFESLSLANDSHETDPLARIAKAIDARCWT